MAAARHEADAANVGTRRPPLPPPRKHGGTPRATRIAIFCGDEGAGGTEAAP